MGFGALWRTEYCIEPNERAAVEGTAPHRRGEIKTTRPCLEPCLWTWEHSWARPRDGDAERSLWGTWCAVASEMFVTYAGPADPWPCLSMEDRTVEEVRHIPGDLGSIIGFLLWNHRWAISQPGSHLRCRNDLDIIKSSLNVHPAHH